MLGLRHLQRVVGNVFKPCVLVPVYNHEHAVARVVEGARAFDLPVILVDDGSNASCARELDRLAAADSRIELLRHTVNRGKGDAMKTGMRNASARGFTHAMQIDADGQHALSDVPRFIDEARCHPDELICGRPIFDADIPAVRFYGRYFSHAMVWLETLSLSIPDSMCGLRLYPIKPMIELIDSTRLGARMDFEIELLVRLNWRNVPMRWLATRVTYPSDGVSHYRYVFDNILVARTHARLLVGMLWRSPVLFWRNLSRLASPLRLSP